MTPAAEDVQSQVLRAFTVLSCVRDDWAGALILNVGLGGLGSAVSLAANVAGAVCLTLEPDAALLRAALRTGSCDFVVNTLDEALRAIKNEIRKHRPLSVGLGGNTAALMAEIIERGVAPELFSAVRSHPQAARHLRSLGALLVSFEEVTAQDPLDSLDPLDPKDELKTQLPDGAVSAGEVLNGFLAMHPYALRSFSFATAAELRAFDARALALLHRDEAGDRLRRRWLQAAASILPRDRHRSLWLTEQEEQLLQSSPA